MPVRPARCIIRPTPPAFAPPSTPTLPACPRPFAPAVITKQTAVAAAAAAATATWVIAAPLTSASRPVAGVERSACSAAAACSLSLGPLAAPSGGSRLPAAGGAAPGADTEGGWPTSAVLRGYARHQCREACRLFRGGGGSRPGGDCLEGTRKAVRRGGGNSYWLNGAMRSRRKTWGLLGSTWSPPAPRRLSLCSICGPGRSVTRAYTDVCREGYLGGRTHKYSAKLFRRNPSQTRPFWFLFRRWVWVWSAVVARKVATHSWSQPCIILIVETQHILIVETQHILIVDATHLSCRRDTSC